MIGRALADGVRSATRRPGLVALLWAWNLVLAGLAALPFWAWIYSATGVSPETDRLLDGLNIGVLVHLVVGYPAAGPVMASAAAVGLAALVSGAFLSGGLLEVLMGSGDDRSLLHRFFRGAGHFFGRFFRLLVIAGLTIVPVTAAVAALLAAATGPLTDGASESAAFWAGLGMPAGVCLTLAFFLLALDYARVMTVASGSRGMFRTWFRALGFTIRHLPGIATIGLLAGVGVVLALWAAVSFDTAYSARAWVVVLGAIAVHQAAAVVRTAVRVGQVAAQSSYCVGLMPPAALVVVQTATPVPTPSVVAEDGAPTPPQAQESVQPGAAIGGDVRGQSE
jgi:hypothetical protein